MPEQKRGFRLITITILLVVIIGLGIYAVNKNKQNGSNDNTTTETTTPSNSTYTYDGEDGKNALTLLQDNYQVELQGEGENAFVTAIDGISAPDGWYWQLEVNGAPARVGAGQLETHNGDQIVWRLVEIQFD